MGRSINRLIVSQEKEIIHMADKSYLADKSYFGILKSINVNNMTEKKGGLTYLAWANAWGALKEIYPLSFYTIYENAQGWNYHTDGRYCWVKTGVTVVDGETQIEHIEELPVMDFKNHSITADRVTSFDVNKAIQRSLTKAIARHGLGLYIYAGEDLPDEKDGEAHERQRVTASSVSASIEEEKQAGRALEEKIDRAEAQTIKDLIEKTGSSTLMITNYYGVEEIEDLTKAQSGQVKRKLMKKLEK